MAPRYFGDAGLLFIGRGIARGAGDLSRESYARLNAAAPREGIMVIGNAPRNLGLDAMFEERQYAVARAEEFIYDRNNSSRDFERIVPRIPSHAAAMVRDSIWLMSNPTAFRIIGLMINDLDAVVARPGDAVPAAEQSNRMEASHRSPYHGVPARAPRS